MSKEKEIEIPTFGYNCEAYKYIVSEHFNVMRARLLNLADTMSQNENQNKASKGLIKDFCNQSYYKIISNLEDYLESFGVIDEDSKNNMTPFLNLNNVEDNMVVS